MVDTEKFLNGRSFVKKQNKFLNMIKKRYFCIPKLLLRYGLKNK